MEASKMWSTSLLALVFISLALTNSFARPLDHIDGGNTPGEEQVSKFGLGLGFRGGWLWGGGGGGFGSFPYGGFGWQGGPYGFGPYGGPTTEDDFMWPLTPMVTEGLSANVDCKSGGDSSFHPHCNPGNSMPSRHGSSMETDDVAKHGDRDMRKMPGDGSSMVKNHDDDNNN